MPEVLGLDNIIERAAGRKQQSSERLEIYPYFGTNGEGSVLAYLSTMLSGAGYRTGRYLSPTRCFLTGKNTG